MDVAGLGGTVAVHDDVLIGGYSLRSVGTAQLGRLLPDVAESFLGEVVLPIVVNGSRYVASSHLGARFAGKLIRRPCIDQKRVMFL